MDSLKNRDRMYSTRRCDSTKSKRRRILASSLLSVAFAVPVFAADAGRRIQRPQPYCPPVTTNVCPPSQNPHLPGGRTITPNQMVPRTEGGTPRPSGEERPAESSSPSQSATPQESSPGSQTDPFAGVDATTPDNNPGANLNDFAASDFSSSSGASSSNFTSAPTIIGDFQGGGLAQFNATVTQNYNFYANGTRGTTPTFDRLPGGGFNPDVLSVSGSGVAIGGPNINQFQISEPLPPTDANTSPGPGFQYQGGTATYTAGTGSDTPSNLDYTNLANSDVWLLDYSFAQQLGFGPGPGPTSRPVPSPGVSVRRVKIAENFSPEIRNRFFTNYSFFNNAFGGLGDISRFIIGMEQVLVDDLMSVEVRLPVAATYGSEQELNMPQDRDFEIGNFTVISKLALWRTERMLVSGGLGIGTPTADDTKIKLNGIDLLRVKNESVQIQPFLGMLFQASRDWTFQSYLQLDVAAGSDPILVNRSFVNPQANDLLEVGKFTDPTLMHLDFAASRLLYLDRSREATVNAILANAELHYTTTLQDSDEVKGTNFNYRNLKNRFDIVNATFGSHFVFNNGLVITPAMSVPLTDGLDRLSDYEAIVQVNYFR